MSERDPGSREFAGEQTAILAASRPPPAQLGRYRLCHELAVGGMATVYLARVEGAAGFEKLVALKIIHAHLSREKTFVDMFLDEARIASLISHPNVCSVFDFGVEQGIHYLAMEFLLGEHLLRILEVLLARKRPDDRRRLPYYAARIVADASEGLHAAHELRGPDGSSLGIVHRDVSPQNLFLTYDGSVKVVDFGVAKAVERLSHTDVGTLKGKVGYVAPEQARSSIIDRRADVWGLGVVLWETLTLRRLFRRDTELRTVMAVLEDPIPTPSSVVGGIPSELDAMVMRALARDPDRRYPTARDLGRDLRRFLTQSGVTVEMAELAEWAQELLHEDREKRLRLVESARMVSAVSREDAGSPPERVADAPQVAPPSTAEPSRVPAGATPSGVMPAAVPRRRRRGRAALLVLVLLVGVGAAGWAYLRETGRLEAGWPWSEAIGPDEGLASDAQAETSAPGEAAGVETEALAKAPSSTGPGADEEASPPEEGAAETGTVEPAPTEGGETDDSRVALDERRAWRPPATPSTASPPASTEPETGAPEPATGSVRIVTTIGWAVVVVGGRELGRTPLSVDLPPGRHTLEIFPFGGEPRTRQTVGVQAGSEITVRIAISSGNEEREPAPTPSSDE